MEKKIRKAVRTYLIEDDKIVVINYTQHDKGYYDIPGGKIEDGETPEEASIREFKEETGIMITKQHYLGNCIIEYPNRIYDFDIFVVDNYQGEPVQMCENQAMWININNLNMERKLFPNIEVIKYLKPDMNVRIECDTNNNILKLEAK